VTDPDIVPAPPSPAVDRTTSPTGAAVVGELRRARQHRRLGDQEWFDVAYRVYLVALAAGAAIVAASDAVNDAVVTRATVADITRHGPGALGLIAAVAVAAGLRSGANGGPVALEAPDVRHLLLAPIPRAVVMRRPVAQRIRSTAAAGALVGVVAGVLAARRLPGSTTAWAAAGAVAGGCAVAIFAATAVIAHVTRVPQTLATACGAALVGAQAVAAGTDVPGPADTFGSLFLWGMRQHGVDVAAVTVTIGVVAFALWRAGELRPEPLLRRADLVSQLRFAVTMQDLRTVVLLRRQMRNEHARARPWPIPFARRAVRTSATTLGATVRRRGWHSIARLPLARLGRSGALAILAGLAVVVTLRGTTPAAIAIGVCLFAMSMEILEPLSQEIDHRDLTGLSPAATDAVLLRALVVPAVVLVPFALVGAATIAVLEPRAAGAAFALAVPCVLTGACGAVVSIAGETRSPDSTASASLTMPEFAGFATVMRTLLPVAISSVAALPVLAMRALPSADTAVRSSIGLLLAVAACAWWVRKHNDYGERVRAFIEEGRR